MRPYDYFLALVLGISLLPADDLGMMAFALMITIIGIPLALCLLAAPALALILIPARLIDRLILRRHFQSSGKPGFSALGIFLALNVLFAMVDNARLSAAVSAIRAGDVLGISRPIAEQAIALVSEGDDGTCADFCQRLLLTGQATSVIVASNKDQILSDAPSFSLPATEFRLQDLGTCPITPSSEDETALDIGTPVGADKEPQASALIWANRTVGRCLTESPATLANADLVIVDGFAQRRAAGREFSFGAGKDMIQAKRREVWVNQNDQFVMAARWTHVSAPRLPWIALPAVLDGLHFEFSKGFLRREWNEPGLQPDLGRFAQEELGLRLSLTGVELPARDDGKDALLQALNTPGTVPEPLQDLLTARLAAETAKDPTASGPQELLLLLLSHPRFHLTRDFYSTASLLIAAAPLQYSEKVAETVTGRIEAMFAAATDPSRLAQDGKPPGLDWRDEQDIYFLSAILAELPELALRPFADVLLARISDQGERTSFRPLVSRLNEFGVPGAMVLLDVLQATRVPRDVNERELYHSAYLGLCAVGPEARVVLPDLLGRVANGQISLEEEPQRLVGLLLALGHPLDKIETLFTTADPKLAESLFTTDGRVTLKSCAP